MLAVIIGMMDLNGSCRRGEAVALAEGHNVTAPRPSLGVAFVAEKGIGVLDRDRADARFLRELSFGGELAVVGINSVYNIVPHQAVKLKVDGAVFLVDNVLHLAI